MPDCSNTEIYLKEFYRMCDTYFDDMCVGCPLKDEEISCFYTIKDNIEHAISVVQKWSNSHPIHKPKTFADMFFEQHPKAVKVHYSDTTIPAVKRCDVYGVSCDHMFICDDSCMRECWNEIYETGS